MDRWTEGLSVCRSVGLFDRWTDAKPVYSSVASHVTSARALGAGARHARGCRHKGKPIGRAPACAAVFVTLISLSKLNKPF